MFAFLTVVGVTGVAVWGAVSIVAVATRFRENMERIKHGYPTLDGKTTPEPRIHYTEKRGDDVYVDMTGQNEYGNNN